jgi:predicted transcriptional regulator YdeE
MFSCLEAQSEIIKPDHKEASKCALSERGIIMSTEQLSNVRIVRLPAMTVASYRAESKTPEDDCSRVFNQFVLENNLHKRDGYRYFGFNNPSPSDGSPVYGYEMWVTVPDDCEVPKPLVKKQFDGGLYASVSTQMNEIGERWQLLHNWCTTSDHYDADSSIQWLEECSMDFEAFISEQVKDSDKQLDLLEPIRRRNV